MLKPRQIDESLDEDYSMYSAADFLKEPVRSPYLINDWIYRYGVHILYGESGSYKRT